MTRRSVGEVRLSLNVAKTLIQTALFWAFFLWLLPMLILQMEAAVGLQGLRFQSAAASAAGWATFALGGALGVASGLIFASRGAGTPLPLDPCRNLVVAGPYRFVRNPMAIAGVTQGVGVGLALGSWLVIAYALAGAPTWHFLVRPWEEAELSRRFGQAYACYRQAVPLWLPSLAPFPHDHNPVSGEAQPVQQIETPAAPTEHPNSL